MVDLVEKIKAEFENLDYIAVEIETLNAKSDYSKYEINSIALYFSNFYNGIENILKQIFKHHNIPLPKSDNWHKELLDIALKEKIITQEVQLNISKYLSFRHFIIHNYSFKLDIELLLPLLKLFPTTYCLFRQEISNEFLSN